MANDTTKLTIELQVLLKNLNRTLRGLNQVQSRLKSIANIRVNTQQVQATNRGVAASRRFTTALQRLQQQQQRLAAQQRQLTTATNRYTTAANRAATAAQAYGQALGRANVAQRAVIAGQQRLAQGQQQITRTATAQNRVLQQVQRQMNSLGAAALRVGGGLRSVGASAAILVTGPLIALGRIASRSAADIDAIRNRLIATEGSLEAANARLNQLRRLADESIGVTRRAAFDTFAILSVVGDVTENTINRQIQAMGRLNAAFTIDDQQQFFRNLIQIFSQGFERADIKEALGRVPIFRQLLQQAFGTADPGRLRELKAAGKLTLDTFLAGLAEAINTDPILSGVGESISVRFQKTFERLTDALEPLGLAILGPLERIITALEPLILRIAAAFASLSPNIQTAIVAVGLLVAALGPLLFILGGIASGIGAFATALAALIPILATIGLPAILAILAGASVLLAELTAAIVALGLAWKTNFLNIRKLVTDAGAAILAAFNRIRAILIDATRRILPSLQSITSKVLNAITAFWERYGKTVVSVIGQTFRFVTDVAETFLRIFTDFIDLIVKLVDSDWRGAWLAFARIVLDGMLSVQRLMLRLHLLIAGTFNAFLQFIIAQGPKFVLAAQELTRKFITTLTVELIVAAPKVRDALATMLLAAAFGVDVVTIAKILASRLGDALGKALKDAGKQPVPGEPQVSVDVGAGAGILRRKPPRRPSLVEEIEEDKKGARTLANVLDKLQEAKDRLAETRADIETEQLRSRLEIQFNATKAGLDRELVLVEQHFEDRIATIRDYFKRRASLEESQINAEIAREIELTGVLNQELLNRREAIEREFQTELKEIDSNDRLKGPAREAAIETAQLKKVLELEKAAAEFRKQLEESQGRVKLLEKDRVNLAADLLRAEKLINEELSKQRAQIGFDLLDAQGRTAEAEAGRLRAQFTETLRELRLDSRSLGKDLQAALNAVDLTVLKAKLDQLPEPIRALVQLLDIGIQRAQLLEQGTQVQRLQNDLQLEATAIQNRVLDGVLSERQAREELLALQLRYRTVLLETLNTQLARAKEIKDLDEVQRIKEQIQEVERLGTAFDEVGQQVNQDFFSGIEDGFAGFFDNARRGFEGLKDAAISFGENMLGILNRLAAHALAEKLFADVFKPSSTNTEGTPGGFFAKLFGLVPKKPLDATAASATLQTGATSAATTLTTGATTAGTSFGSIVTTSAASFASIVVSAATALATAVGLSTATSAGGAAGGGLGSLLGAAATGLYPAVPGGVYKVVEGGYPEAVLTTDPKHATRQLGILKAFLRETKGLGGRIRGFAAGAFISPHEAQSAVLGGLAGPSISNPAIGGLTIAGTPSMMKLRQVLVSENQLPDWVNSSEGEQVLVDFLYRKGHIIRKLGGK